MVSTRRDLVLFAVLLLLAAPVRADTSAASQAFDAGKLAFDAGRYDEALEAFGRAQAAQPHDQVRFAIASCLEKLSRFVEARDAYQAIGTSEALNEEQRTEAGRAIARIESVLGTLRIASALTGATAVVDGRQQCTVPCALRVDPRAHDVEIRSGATVLRRRVVLSRGADVSVALSPATEGGPAAVAPPAIPAAAGPGPSALTWVGAGTAAVGLGGTIGFGLRATGLG
jgi:hypothetical protein